MPRVWPFVWLYFVAGFTIGLASMPPQAQQPALPLKAPLWQPDLSLVIERVEPSIVAIKTGQRFTAAGVVVTAKGDIITVRHAIGGKLTSTQVQFSDERIVTAKVVRRDEPNDLALLHVDVPEALPTLPMADHKSIVKGLKVLCIGHPYGYGWTATDGMISGTKRTIQMPTGEFLDVFQLTAGINPGNSGGAVINLRGELVGMVVAQREGHDLGFAHSISRIQTFLQQ